MCIRDSRKRAFVAALADSQKNFFQRGAQHVGWRRVYHWVATSPATRYTSSIAPKTPEQRVSMYRIFAAIACLSVSAALLGLPGCAKTPPAASDSPPTTNAVAEAIRPEGVRETWDVYLL